MHPADRPERGGRRVRLVGGILVALLIAAILIAYVVVSRPWDLHQHRPAVHRSTTSNGREVGGGRPRQKAAPPGEEGGAGQGGGQAEAGALPLRVFVRVQ